MLGRVMGPSVASVGRGSASGEKFGQKLGQLVRGISGMFEPAKLQMQWRVQREGSASPPEDRTPRGADVVRHIGHRTYASGGTTVTGQFARSTQCSPTDPIILLAVALRPRWPTTSSSAPSAALHKTSPG